MAASSSASSDCCVALDRSARSSASSRSTCLAEEQRDDVDLGQRRIRVERVAEPARRAAEAEGHAVRLARAARDARLGFDVEERLDARRVEEVDGAAGVTM